MRIQFIGATQTVTGSKYLITIDNYNILVDCGLFQGLKELRLRNRLDLPIAPKDIHAVILTHAHIDHSGYVPLLVKNGFKGKIYCTPATKDLCELMLPDSGFLHEEEARRANKYGYSKHKPALPLYTKEDAEIALEQFVSKDFGLEHILPTKHNNSKIIFHFYRAGHILGASSLLIKTSDKSIVFSGDLGRTNDSIMYDPEPIPQADYIVVESTYGNRIHPDINPQDQLEKIINRTIKRGGTLVIPAFAVGRTQSILHYIYKLKQDKKLPIDLPIFLDSPMATDATYLFERYHREHRLSASESLAVCNVTKYVNSVEESKLLDTNPFPKIIISASGMAVGGRVLHHLKAFASDEKNTILFCGYQSVGTRGDKMINGTKDIKIFGENVVINAEIAMLDNISAHADSQEIIAWLKGFKDNYQHNPQQVFITHGEHNASLALQEKIIETFKWRCVVPSYLQVFYG